mmetsp:Transcript_29792/g.45017  ORF Transcript_29792/g.45017 Transcript_29792/m.45017 type:complete len:80 (+) Transcript_29792:398-637(+)
MLRAASSLPSSCLPPLTPTFNLSGSISSAEYRMSSFEASGRGPRHARQNQRTKGRCGDLPPKTSTGWPIRRLGGGSFLE